MIIDTLANSSAYENINSGFKAAFDFLHSPKTPALPSGKHEISGKEIFAIIESGQGKGQQEGKLEFHRKYIDVQFVVDGNECMGWSPANLCTLDDNGFDTSGDIGFCNEKPQAWFQVLPGQFTIFFPDDAHAPLCGTGSVSKIIVKIAV